MILITGLLVGLVCLAFQALTSVFAARHFAHISRRPIVRRSALWIFTQYSVLMIILMLGNIVQIGIWGLLYLAVGAFHDLETAMYFSGVTFTTLGYGDVVLRGSFRLMAPLQAANGLMMFGITTSVFIAAIQQSIVRKAARMQAEAPGRPGTPAP